MPKIAELLNPAMRRTSISVSWFVGHHLTVAAIATTAIGWAVYGLVTGFTTEWFLLSNVTCTVGSFLILVVVQHSRRRETLAIQTKLDQLILSSDRKNHWIGAQKHEVEVIDEMRSRHHSNR